MNRTIKDIYNLIISKRYNAQLDFDRHKYMLPTKTGLEFELYLSSMNQIKGQMDAYTDIICLIESSGVLNEV